MRARDLLEIDYFLLLSTVVLSIFGILFIYSSAVTSSGVLVSQEYIRQIIWSTSGFVIALVLAMIDYRRTRNLAVYLYLGTLALLIYTCLFGKLVNGARAWIGVGSFGIQPSEFAKITTILLLARYLDSTRRSPTVFIRFLVSCVIVFIPMGLILIQPDFGTSLVFIPILLTMTFIAGVSLRYLLFLAATISITGVLTVLPLWQRYIMHNTIPVLGFLTNSRFIMSTMIALGIIAAIALVGFLRYKKRYFFWILYGSMVVILSLGLSFGARRVLKDYQIMRLIVFLDPNVDPQGAGWNIIQSIPPSVPADWWGRATSREPRAITVFYPSRVRTLFFLFLLKNGDSWGGFWYFFFFCSSVLGWYGS
jgi:rod shape determining protein RodA